MKTIHYKGFEIHGKAKNYTITINGKNFCSPNCLITSLKDAKEEINIYLDRISWE